MDAKRRTSPDSPQRRYVHLEFSSAHGVGFSKAPLFDFLGQDMARSNFWVIPCWWDSSSFHVWRREKTSSWTWENTGPMDANGNVNSYQLQWVKQMINRKWIWFIMFIVISIFWTCVWCTVTKMVETLYATPKFDAYHPSIYCPSPRNYGLKKAHV